MLTKEQKILISSLLDEGKSLQHITSNIFNVDVADILGAVGEYMTKYSESDSLNKTAQTNVPMSTYKKVGPVGRVAGDIGEDIGEKQESQPAPAPEPVKKPSVEPITKETVDNIMASDSASENNKDPESLLNEETVDLESIRNRFESKHKNEQQEKETSAKEKENNNTRICSS